MVDFPSAADSNFKRITIYIGGYYAAKEPAVIKTVLGSCIAVCLFENKLKFGGMNHFMLPEMKEWEKPEDDYNHTRYGLFAMEVLINEIIKLGGKKENLTAKIFGGGHVLTGMTSNLLQIPDKNIKFAKTFLAEERIPIISEDIGGSWPRKVFFFNTENRVLMKKMETQTKEFSIEQEVKYSKSLQNKIEEKSDITLF
mgnify:FL=1